MRGMVLRDENIAFEAIATALGWKNPSGASPPPGLPSVIKTLPSGLNLKTRCRGRL